MNHPIRLVLSTLFSTTQPIRLVPYTRSLNAKPIRTLLQTLSTLRPASCDTSSDPGPSQSALSFALAAPDLLCRGFNLCLRDGNRQSAGVHPQLSENFFFSRDRGKKVYILRQYSNFELTLYTSTVYYTNSGLFKLSTLISI